MTIRLIVKILYLSLFAGSLTGCAHTLGKSKSEDLVGLLADSKSKSGVTEEQAAYLEKYLYRHSAIDEVDDYFIRDADYPFAKSIEDAVSFQKKYFDEIERKEQKDINVREKIKNNFYQNIQAIKSAVSVRYINKKIRVDEDGNEILSLIIGMENNSGKDVHQVRGKMLMMTNDGIEAATLKINNHQVIRSGSSSLWKGSYSLDTNLNGLVNKRLAKISDKDLKGIWVPELILFSDKSRLQISE